MEREEVTPKAYPENILNKDWSKRKCFYSKGAGEFLNKLHDFPIKDDDVWIVTLPKCGTTWMQELVWLVLNDFDFEGAKAEHLEVRTPFMEFDYLVYRDLNRAFKPVETLKAPRLIKSHLPLPLLPSELWTKQPKVIYVYRNPKDAIVSDYYHTRSNGRCLDKTLEEYVNQYLEQDAVKALPFEHVTEFYALRNEPWIYYTSFELMKADLRQVIEHICTFLDKSITQEQMAQMLHHLSFEQMKVLCVKEKLVATKTSYLWK